MNLRVAMSCEVKGDDSPSRSESEAEEAVEYDGADAKPCDLPVARLKLR